MILRRLYNRSKNIISLHTHDYNRIIINPNDRYNLGELTEEQSNYYKSLNSIGLVLEKVLVEDKVTIKDDLIDKDIESEVNEIQKAINEDIIKDKLDIESMTKSEIKYILDLKGIEYQESATKSELIKICKSNSL